MYKKLNDLQKSLYSFINNLNEVWNNKTSKTSGNQKFFEYSKYKWSYTKPIPNNFSNVHNSPLPKLLEEIAEGTGIKDLAETAIVAKPDQYTSYGKYLGELVDMLMSPKAGNIKSKPVLELTGDFEFIDTGMKINYSTPESLSEAYDRIPFIESHAIGFTVEGKEDKKVAEAIYNAIKEPHENIEIAKALKEVGILNERSEFKLRSTKEQNEYLSDQNCVVNKFGKIRESLIYVFQSYNSENPVSSVPSRPIIVPETSPTNSQTDSLLNETQISWDKYQKIKVRKMIIELLRCTDKTELPPNYVPVAKYLQDQLDLCKIEEKEGGTLYRKITFTFEGKTVPYFGTKEELESALGELTHKNLEEYSKEFGSILDVRNRGLDRELRRWSKSEDEALREYSKIIKDETEKMREDYDSYLKGLLNFYKPQSGKELSKESTETKQAVKPIVEPKETETQGTPKPIISKTTSQHREVKKQEEKLPLTKEEYIKELKELEDQLDDDSKTLKIMFNSYKDGAELPYSPWVRTAAFLLNCLDICHLKDDNGRRIVEYDKFPLDNTKITYHRLTLDNEKIDKAKEILATLRFSKYSIDFNPYVPVISDKRGRILQEYAYTVTMDLLKPIKDKIEETAKSIEETGKQKVEVQPPIKEKPVTPQKITTPGPKRVPQVPRKGSKKVETPLLKIIQEGKTKNAISEVIRYDDGVQIPSDYLPVAESLKDLELCTIEEDNDMKIFRKPRFELEGVGQVPYFADIDELETVLGKLDYGKLSNYCNGFRKEVKGLINGINEKLIKGLDSGQKVLPRYRKVIKEEVEGMIKEYITYIGDSIKLMKSQKEVDKFQKDIDKTGKILGQPEELTPEQEAEAEKETEKLEAEIKTETESKDDKKKAKKFDEFLDNYSE